MVTRWWFRSCADLNRKGTPIKGCVRSYDSPRVTPRSNNITFAGRTDLFCLAGGNACKRNCVSSGTVSMPYGSDKAVQKKVSRRSVTWSSKWKCFKYKSRVDITVPKAKWEKSSKTYGDFCKKYVKQDECLSSTRIQMCAGCTTEPQIRRSSGNQTIQVWICWLCLNMVAPVGRFDDSYIW